MAGSRSVCHDRVRRAREIRDEMGGERSQYMGADEQPRRFALVRGETDTRWTFVVNALIPMPVRPVQSLYSLVTNQIPTRGKTYFNPSVAHQRFCSRRFRSRHDASFLLA
jgi:hypothetical protein